MTLKRILGAAALLLTPAIAFAHPGHGDNGLMAGISHPIGGLDHLLAMFAVGLWAAQQQGSARWALPSTFVGTMLLGGLLGFEGLNLPALEGGIAASVLALGLAVALAVRPPLSVAMGLAVALAVRPPLSVAMGATAVFALFHGVAHGLELPDMSSPWAYAAGFVAATALLHGLGYAVVRVLPQAAAPLVRMAGAASAATGVWLLAG
jgi:urease accessory protein